MGMKHSILVTGALLGALLIGSRYYMYSPLYTKVTRATALIYPTKGNSGAGVIKFAEEKEGLHITAHLTGLTPGEHGFHIHEFGMCNCDDAVCAGDHYNPTNSKHGGPDDNDRHAGDFGNIVADEQGIGRYDRVDKQATLNGPHSIIGRTVIIHAGADDFTTQPSGNAGARIACGIVGIAK